ncbi:DUF928 domain-containing protein [Aetokthonos hydrillicola Thurmond2011]|uniref:DUF928 domain-containing protein n=1 Tax=Aetokthonos hydrillicola Thurmond2011 TaxID=2712845 RepID=A0AAP5MDI3_9CYAN|nr:DUF928 domain-containing protein [Aetokthonos hydrillicola]MBO3459590.1 DUF928 domain-containing protein [Aetokthonos hydrillicola CCALA 1050]MBW4590956.1 DUF928 domain-containing protein [Aetokthonos hydrillicola CCALA 1050]MDR9899374.1 DUF928 domain-containing protein [Aetokthonos hydrillicola Thurmond2011]
MTTFVSTILTITFTPGWTKPSLPEIAALPPAPDNGTPIITQRTPGGTRGGVCQQKDKPQAPQVTALVPINVNQSLTTAEYPVFWFYIPDTAVDVSSIEFSIHDREEKSTLYRKSLQLTKIPGVFRIALPPNPQFSLRVNETYSWRLIVNCTSASTEIIEVSGFVRRLQKNPNLPGMIWYDELSNRGKLYLLKPHNSEVKNSWIELLKAVGLEGIAQAPLY